MATHDTLPSQSHVPQQHHESETCRIIGDERVHRHQLVVRDREGFDQRFVVVRFTDGGLVLNDDDFDGVEFEISHEKWVKNNYESVTASGTPVWVY